MSEEVFHAVYRGGVWWVERFRLVGRTITGQVIAGPYKYRKAAESRVRAEQQKQQEDSREPNPKR